jgi:hypothetical protein
MATLTCGGLGLASIMTITHFGPAVQPVHQSLQICSPYVSNTARQCLVQHIQ